MAVSDVQREGENESRLHRERLASRRVPDDVVGPGTWQPPPPVAPPAQPQGAQDEDRRVGGIARQQRMENQLNFQRRQKESPPEKPRGGDSEAPSIRDVAKLAKASPAGAVAGSLGSLGSGKGLPLDEIQRGVGRGCVRMLWQFVWPSFGHTIYLIGIIFLIAWSSKFARKYVPEVGEEWFPPDLLKKIPKPMLIPIKLAELVGMAFILFFVFMLDILCLGSLAMLLAIIFTVA